MESNMNSHEFDWLHFCAPEFRVCGSQIDILDSPKSFHTKLKTEARHARKRIVLAALYLGTGKLEKELVNAVAQTAKETSNKVKIDILLDCIRGSRGEENSKTMLSPLMEQCEGSNNLNIALYHTPKLRGLLKTCLPARWNEVVGVAHLKVFIFDDTFIISGANLSNDYFESRQDRYMVFHNCPQLADYFHSLVKTVSTFSFTLLPDQSIGLNPDCEHHPYKGNCEKFKQEAHNSLRKLIQPPCMSENSSDGNTMVKRDKNGFFSTIINLSVSFITYWSTLIFSTLNMIGSKESIDVSTQSSAKVVLRQKGKSEKDVFSEPDSETTQVHDTWVYPTVQMGLFGIRQDEVVTEMLMKSFPIGSSVSFTTGYFNVTDNYCNLMVKNATNYKILLASPEANGFLGSSGFSGYIPSVYVHLCKKFMKKVRNFGRENDISMWEYVRKGWTFHGKGMWCYLQGETQPSMTLIGSPNFGLRSVNRDLEAQVVVVTKNEKLRKLLHKEQKNLMKHSQRITKETFQQPRYNVPRWVALVTFFIKRYF